MVVKKMVVLVVSDRLKYLLVHYMLKTHIVVVVGDFLYAPVLYLKTKPSLESDLLSFRLYCNS